MSETHIEALIAAASELKEAVERLGEAYDVMPAIIAKEHKAIRAHDFAAVAAALATKEEAGQRVEDCFGALTRAADRLGALGAVPARPRSLTECVAALSTLAAATAESGLGGQVLRHQVDGLSRAAAAFAGRFTKVKAQIEANRALIGTLLENFQESYRFWMEVAEKEATAYNAQGVQAAKGRNSGFVSRA